MSDTPSRRTNWTSASGDIDDPLAELERIVSRTQKAAASPFTPTASSAPAQPRAPVATTRPATPVPSQTSQAINWPELPKTPLAAKPAPAQPQAAAPKSDFLGISENDFEAAFRSFGEKPVTPPQPERAPAAPVFSAPPPPPVRQPFTSRVEPSFQNDTFENETSFDNEPSSYEPPQNYASPKSAFESDFTASLSRGKPTDFEHRADAFDFDTRATETAADDTIEDDDQYEEAQPAAYYLENKQRSGLVTVIAVTGLVFVAVIGALIYSWVGSSSSGDPVIIKADNSPVKTVPKADDTQPSNKLIYDRLGSASEETNDEKLVSREEQPVETLNPADTTAQAPRVVLPNPAAQDKTALNAPRQVTTTTIRVKPDGTLESIPAPADSTASTNVAEPQTPEIKPPVVATETSPRTSIPAVKQAVDKSVKKAEAEAEAEAAPAVEEEAPSMADSETTPVPPPQVTQPQQRVANIQPAQMQRAATTTPKATTAKTPATAGTGGVGFVVQISSQRSDAAARSSFTAMQQRFPAVLGSYQPSIKPVALGDKGTYYRVRVGPLASRDDATALCGRLKAAGGDCVVTAN
ncbi:MAG: SPOR domain-containing protein [Pseudomonadota bacterium]